VLLKQEKFEAEGTVKGRLEFIGKEMYGLGYSFPLPPSAFSAWHSTWPTNGCCSDRVEDNIKDIQKKIESKRAELIQVQAAAQQAAQGGAPGGKGKEVAT